DGVGEEAIDLDASHGGAAYHGERQRTCSLGRPERSRTPDPDGIPLLAVSERGRPPSEGARPHGRGPLRGRPPRPPPFQPPRRGLTHRSGPEAEALYDACSAAVDKADAATLDKRARAAGFRGWKVEIAMKDPRGRARLEALVARELSRAGVDLSTAAIDEEKV